MAVWNSTPEWTNPSGINSGQQYNAGDGLNYLDMRAIVHNLIYLYNERGGNKLPLTIGDTATTLQNISEATDNSAGTYSYISGDSCVNYGDFSVMFGTGGINQADYSCIFGNHIYTTSYSSYIFAMGNNLDIHCGGFYYGYNVDVYGSSSNYNRFIVATHADINNVTDVGIIAFNGNTRRANIENVTSSHIFAEGPVINNTSRSFIAGFRPEVTGDYSGYNYGNFVFGINYINDNRGQYTTHNIRHSAFIGPYMTAYNSYADTVLGSTQNMYETQYCYIGGHNNAVGNSNGAYIFGRSINADNIDHSMITGSYHNINSLDNSAVFGESMNIYPSEYFYDDYDGSSLATKYVLGGGSAQNIYGVQYSILNGYANTVKDCQECIIVSDNSNIWSTWRSILVGRNFDIGSESYPGANVSDCMYLGTAIVDFESSFTSNIGYRLTNELNYCSTIAGFDIAASYLNYTSVLGSHHALLSVDWCGIYGKAHTATNAEYCFVSGNANTIDGSSSVIENCTLVGKKLKLVPYTRGDTGDTISPKCSVIFGESCHAHNIYSLTAGYGLVNYNPYEIMAGRFATLHFNSAGATQTTGTRYLFTLGDGTSNNARKDALLFYAKDGEYFLKLGTLTISETKMKKIMDFIDGLT